MNRTHFAIIWPERKLVPAHRIRTWYEDAVVNGEVDVTGDTIEEMARALDDAGLITLHKVQS